MRTDTSQIRASSRMRLASNGQTSSLGKVGVGLFLKAQQVLATQLRAPLS